MGDFTNIVHELITPINLIYSSLQVIEKNGSDLLESDQAIRRNINIMKLNTTRVLKLVENIIDFTKLETGYNDFNPETANIVSFIETTCLSIVEFASEKQIELIFESETAELFLSFDKDKIERILLNLLSNSIKYNKENGIIKINLSTKEDYFNIKLIDNGIGIPKDKIEKVFDRYEKVNRVGIGRPRGSGIGLALVKSMVNMHNGKISLKSEVDVGTEFIISLPI
ncbi:sensor histidine kinase [Metaclostridioides mangenotii]|nr:HAMP domain-containing sensor histidine kinase [Clostridioides mangenotii]